jgi:catechol 2,3-dioxygenase
MSTFSIDPAVRIGHVHLRVADLERSRRFYCELLGFTVTADGRPVGVQALFLAAGDYHHHLGLSAVPGGSPAPAGHTGLYHFALVYPGPAELTSAVARLQAHGHAIDLAQDHGGTVSVYLRDPDGNGIELYYDRPRSAWFDAQGRAVLKAERIAVEDILELESAAREAVGV